MSKFDLTWTNILLTEAGLIIFGVLHGIYYEDPLSYLIEGIMMVIGIISFMVATASKNTVNVNVFLYTIIILLYFIVIGSNTILWSTITHELIKKFNKT